MEFQGGVRAAPDVKPAPQSSSIKPAAAPAGGGAAGAGGSLGGRKKKQETKSHLASMRAGNSVTLRMCVVILPAAVEAGGVTLANHPRRKNRGNSPRLSPLTDKLLQS